MARLPWVEATGERSLLCRGQGQPVNRRSWLRVAGGAAVGGLASGCSPPGPLFGAGPPWARARTGAGRWAGARARGWAGTGVPLPVGVSRDRVIRVVAGLRPYRPEGFVVRAERLGDKLLVHNYGHGGGGVSLSWGTAHMAADLVTNARPAGEGRAGSAAATGSEARPGSGARAGPEAGAEATAIATPPADADAPAADVAVLGAGAVGLATARLLQRRGRTVAIYARDLPPNTTSNMAGAQWSPTSVADSLDGPFGAQFERASRLAHRHFQDLAGDPTYGVRWIDNWFPSERPPRAGYRSRIAGLYPETDDLEGDEHPFPTRYARRMATMFIEPPRYLRAVMRDFRAAGGRVVVGEIADLRHLASLPESVVVNCTGLGARDLFGDDTMVPIKGQLVVLRPQAHVDYLSVGGGRFSSEGSHYMFPRSDGVLLGGTYERGESDVKPDPRQTERILADHRSFFRAMAEKIRG